jgi:hypothetical protein
MNSEIEVAVVTWALTGLTGAVGYVVRGRQARQAERAGRLGEVDAAVQALMGAIASVDLGSNTFAAQRSGRVRLALGVQAVAELVDGYRQQRVPAGMVRALDKALEFDRRVTTASGEFAAGPLHAVVAANLRLTMVAGGFPELTSAAKAAADAVCELAGIRSRARPAAEQQKAEETLGRAETELGRAWGRLSEPSPSHWRRLTPRRRPRTSPPPNSP